MSKFNLSYKNKEGISLKQVLDIIRSNKKISKKEIINKLNAKKSIDTLLNKLITQKYIEKITSGRFVYFIPKNTPEKDKESDIKQINPYSFILNYFNNEFNNELATQYFRRRDNYTVKSIYNKLKTMCEMIDNYDTDQQHQPFYRLLSINQKEAIIKIYHLDMQRKIRGIYKLFKINSNDISLIFNNENRNTNY